MNSSVRNYKTKGYKTPLISISLFFILLLFQSYLPLVNVVEAVLLINLFTLGHKLKLIRQESVLIIILFLSGTISMIFHNDSAFFTYWHYCIVTPILLYLNGKLIKDEKDFKTIVYIISIICLVIWSISIFLTPERIEIKDNQWTDEHTRLFRLFYAYDVVANGTTIIVFLIPSFCIFFLKAETYMQKTIKTVSILLLLYCIYKSESRSALVCMFILSVYYIKNTKLKDKIKYVFFTIILLSFISVFFDLTSFIPERFSFSYSEKTGLTSRDLIWGSALAIISQNFFGIVTPYMEILGQTFSPHNNFLTFWILFGWVTGVTITYIFFAVEIASIRNYKKIPHYLPFIVAMLFVNFFFESAAVAVPFTFCFYALVAGFLFKEIASKNVLISDR